MLEHFILLDEAYCLVGDGLSREELAIAAYLQPFHSQLGAIHLAQVLIAEESNA